MDSGLIALIAYFALIGLLLLVVIRAVCQPIKITVDQTKETKPMPTKTERVTLEPDETMPPPSPWMPVDDKELLARLGKMNEEANELGAILSRTIVQGGLDQRDPKTNVSNRDNLLKEMADMQAQINLMLDYLLPGDRTSTAYAVQQQFDKRVAMKMDHKQKWFDGIITAQRKQDGR